MSSVVSPCLAVQGLLAEEPTCCVVSRADPHTLSTQPQLSPSPLGIALLHHAWGMGGQRGRRVGVRLALRVEVGVIK